MNPLPHPTFFKWFRVLMLATPALYLLYLARFWVWFLYPLPTNILQFTMVLLCGIWLIGVWKFRFPKPKMANKWQYPAVLFFLLVATVMSWKTVIGLEAGRSFPLAIWLDVFVMPVGYFFMMVSVLRGQKDLQDLVLVTTGFMALAASLMSLQYAFGWLSPVQFTDDLRLVWPYVDHLSGSALSANMPAIFLAPFLCLAWMAFLKTKTRLTQSYFGISIFLMAIAIFLTQSYGAWLAVIGACSLCSFIELRGIKRWLLVPLISVALVAGLYWTQQNSEKLRFALDVSEEVTVTTSSERLNIWNVSWDLIKRYPISGVGTAQFGRAYVQQAPLTLGREVSAKELSHSLQPHNVYLMFWLNHGLLGLLSFLIVIVVFAKPVSKQWRWILFCPLLYWLAHGLIDVYYWKPDYAYGFWLIMAMMVMGSRNATIQATKKTNS